MFWKKKKPLHANVKAIKRKPISTAVKHRQDPIENSETMVSTSNSAHVQKTKHQTLDYHKEFLNTFRKLTYRHHSWAVWHDFITMFACSLSNPLDKTHRDKREKLYLKIIQQYRKDEQELFPQLAAQTILALDENPEQDFLGSLFMSLDLGNDRNGQFFTPYHICELMSEITINDPIKEIKENGYISINDCCCGAGATLIAGVHTIKRKLESVNLNYQNHVLVVAQDIDETVGLMCYIQLSLLGVAGCVKIGNTLTDPISSNDSKENYWYTPMYFSHVWTMRRLIQNIFN